ncbi:Ribonuclease H domain [Sesbania bispinosa]|nr:Ribonuclease H domain [Sesbania bispinosa]
MGRDSNMNACIRDIMRDGGLKSACGELFRNSAGMWIDGFVRNTGQATITMSELWGIYSALSLAERRNFEYVWIETDSLTAVTLIHKGVSTSHPCWSIIQAIKVLLLKYPNTRISHVFREGNRAADWLVDFAFNFTLGFHPVSSPPSGIIPILRDDSVGVAFHHRSVL